MELLDGRARDVIRIGIEYLAGVCDHATSRDLMGFSANTAGLGHELSRLPDRYWNDGTFVAAARILKHHRQQALTAGVLQEDFVPVLERIADGPEEDVATAWMADDAMNGGIVLSAAKEMADLVRLLRKLPGAHQPAGRGRLWVVDAEHAFALRGHLDRFNVHGEAIAIVASSAAGASEDLVKLVSDRVVDVEAEQFALTFPYDAVVVARIKALKGRIYDGKKWLVTATKENAELIRDLADEDFVATSKAKELVENALLLPDAPPTPQGTRRVSAALREGKIRLGFKYAPDIVAALKSLPKEQRAYNSVHKSWSVDPTALEDLLDLLRPLAPAVDASDLEAIKETAPTMPGP